MTRMLRSTIRRSRALIDSRITSRPDKTEGPGHTSDTFDTRSSARFRRSRLSRYHVDPGRFDDIRVSVVLPTFNRAESLRGSIESVRAQSHENWELLIVDDGSTDHTGTIVAEYTQDPRIHYFRTENRGVGAARNHALDMATGSLVAYLDSDNTWTPEFLRLMVIEVVSEDLDCAYSSVQVVDTDGETIFYRGDAFDWEECRRLNYIDINTLVHDRSLADQRFETTLRRMVDWDFILRITRDAKVGFAPFLGCTYMASAEDPLRITRREPEVWAKVIRARNGADGSIAGWEQVASQLRFGFAIKIAAPEVGHEEWGDFHFAGSLTRALESLGHDARIVFREGWRRGKRADVNITLRGLKPFEPDRGPIDVLWNVSHPDRVTWDEVTSSQIAYVASESHARLLDLEAGDEASKIGVLLQCTDPSLFNPDRKHELSPYSADVLFVGNSRADFRPMVRWALEADLDVEVYGRGWDQFVSDRRVHDDLIDNDDLGAAYASSRVVLNDHWASMRDFGVVSNRVFDVVATAARLISDRMPALDSLFGDSVAQVGSAEELSREAEGPGPPQEVRIELAGWVGGHHTFDHRARVMVDDVLSFLNLPRMHGTRNPGDITTTFRPRPERPRIGVIIPHAPDLCPTPLLSSRLLAPLATELACDRLEVAALATSSIDEDLDVVVVQTASAPDPGRVTELLDRIDGLGVSLVVDVVASGAVSRGADRRTYALERLLNAADMVWFESAQLQQNHESGLTRPNKVVAHSIDPRVWRVYKRSTDRSDDGSSSGRFLMFGSGDVSSRLGLVLPALRELARDVAFELVVAGDEGELLPSEPWITRFDRPTGLLNFEFGRWLRSLGPFAAGLSPDLGRPVNPSRIDFEFLRFSALGLLSVVSDVEPVSDVIQRDLAVFCEDDWLETLTQIIEAPEKFRRVRDRAENHVWAERTVETTARILVADLEALLAGITQNPSRATSSHIVS